MNQFTEYKLRASLWPSVIYIFLAMIIGCVGNSLIIYIYRHHFHRSVPWMFIYVLAVVDLLASLFSMPVELLIMFTYTDFPSEALCKISRYVTFVLHGSSCVILMGIAYNRYEKVCRPNNPVLNLTRAKIFCIVTMIFSCCSFIPSLFVYGELKVGLVMSGNGVQFAPPNMKLNSSNGELVNVPVGRFCIITQNEETLAAVFYSFQFVMYLLLGVLVVYFYSRVVYTMLSYNKKQKLLLLRLNSQANGIDKTTDDKKIYCNQNHSCADREQSADFSKDFCQNEITELKNSNENENNIALAANGHQNELNTTKAEDVRDNQRAKIIISPPIVLSEPSDEGFHHHSADNILLDLTKQSNDAVETNKLLMRRIQSTDNFHKLALRIPPPLQTLSSVDPCQAFYDSLFLHAPKTQKKITLDRASTKKKSKDKSSKSVSRSKSNVDISMRMVKADKNIRNEKGGSLWRSMEGLSTMRCTQTNLTPDGTMTLSKKSSKGSVTCVIPVTGLSLKSATNYDTKNETEQTQNCVEVEDTNKSVRENEDDDNGKNVAEEKEVLFTSKSVDSLKPRERVNTVSFKTEESSAKKTSSREKDTSSDPDSRTSENILTPEPKAKVRSVDVRRRSSVQPIRAHRTSRMLFWISLAFLLSFLPFWIIVFIRLCNKTAFDGLSDAEFAFVSLFIRFTHISNAINPVIYWYLNKQFRERCSKIMRGSKKGHSNTRKKLFD